MIVERHPHTSDCKATLLVIEDEPRSQRLLRLNLEPLGYRVETITSASSGAEVLAAYRPELIVLDLILPDLDGISLLRQIRAVSSVPIIIVTGVGRTEDRVRGLKLGADDYVIKPYDPAELAARIGAVLRRAPGLPPVPASIFRSGELEIDFTQRLVRIAGQEVRLTGTEYRLLECLAEHAGRTLVADAIIAKVWGAAYEGEYASLHLYISRLRRKLGDGSQPRRWIVTRPAIGYELVADEGRERQRGG